jgi:hypothetical protein
MRLLATGETVGHVDFYVAITAAYVLIFISINVVLLSGDEPAETGSVKLSSWSLWFVLGSLVSAWGVAIPLAILAGLMFDTMFWRVLALIATVGELGIALAISSMYLATTKQTGSASVTTKPKSDTGGSAEANDD